MRALFLFFLFSMYNAQARVLIFTYSYNRPDFIELQHKTFKKFLKDEYQLVVFNDARDPDLYKKIKATCKKLNINHIKIPQEIHGGSNSPSERNCNVVQYSLTHYGFHHDDIVVLLDSDMFLIKPFSIKKFMANYDLAALPQKRGSIEYLWIGLVFLNMATMPNKNSINFSCGTINGAPVDTGGYSYYYLVDNPTARVGYLNQSYHQSFSCNACLQSQSPRVCNHNTLLLQQLKFDANFIKLLQKGPSSAYYHEAYMEFLLDQTFLHYRSASNWDGKPAKYHKYKTKIVNKFINEITK